MTASASQFMIRCVHQMAEHMPITVSLSVINRKRQTWLCTTKENVISPVATVQKKCKSQFADQTACNITMIAWWSVRWTYLSFWTRHVQEYAKNASNKQTINQAKENESQLCCNKFEKSVIKLKNITSTALSMISYLRCCGSLHSGE